MRTCEICKIIPELRPEYVIYEGEHWVANLRERDQTLLGTTFITARRHVPELDQLKPEEDQEFVVIRNALFGAIRGVFTPVIFNTSCLKNDAFYPDPDTTPPNQAHVHWHIKPRYGTQPVEFAGDTFQDPFPGRYLALYERKRPSPEVASAIASAIRENFSLQP